MAVKIRLTRVGKKRQPSYRVVVTDSRSPRDGRYIEQIGRYDPLQEPSLVEIDAERATYWLSNGAQPTSQAKKLLEIAGALKARAVKPEKVHVVGEAAQKAAAVDDAALIAAAEAEKAARAAADDVVAAASAMETESPAEATPEIVADEPATDEETS